MSLNRYTHDYAMRVIREFGGDQCPKELKEALRLGQNLIKWLKHYSLSHNVSYPVDGRKAANEVLVALQIANINNPEPPVGEALRQFIVRRGLAEEHAQFWQLKKVA